MENYAATKTEVIRKDVCNTPMGWFDESRAIAFMGQRGSGETLYFTRHSHFILQNGNGHCRLKDEESAVTWLHVHGAADDEDFDRLPGRIILQVFDLTKSLEI